MPLHSALVKATWPALAVLLNLMLPPAAAQANNVPIAVAPVMVRLEATADIAGVEVSNRGETPSGVEVEIMRVKWVNGLEQYEPTQDFVVSPPSFRLLAGKGRMVRFKYGGTRSEQEGFYRLFIRQLPPEQSDSQINMIFNLGIPVFISPVKSIPALELSAGRDELRNTGNVTLTVLQLQGKDCAAPVPVAARIAPGQKIGITAAQARCANMAQTDKGVMALSAP